jgi:ABC-type polysaccharide/polyol phosphate export permease
MLEIFRLTYRHRALIWLLAVKELKIRYNRSALGFLWALFHPLLMAVVLTIVFSSLLRIDIQHYPVFLLSTLFPWTFFSQSLHYATQSIVSNGSLLKKVYVPKMVFPLASILANLVNFVLSLAPLALVLVLLRFPFHWTWGYLPVPILSLVVFATGCGLILATANVFYRDVSQILQILLAAWFYASPIIYDLHFVSPGVQAVLRLNPLADILGAFRLSIYGTVEQGLLPSAESMLVSLAVPVLTLLVGCAIFRKYEDSLVYYV